jgi:hypothetical protein
MFKSYRELHAMVFTILIMALWVGNAFLPKPLPSEITGATIVVFTLMFQFFYRKSGTQNNGSGSTQ